MYDAFYKLTNSSKQISSYVFDVVRASVPKMNLVCGWAWAAWLTWLASKTRSV